MPLAITFTSSVPPVQLELLYALYVYAVSLVRLDSARVYAVLPVMLP